MIEKTEALVLRVLSSSETSRIVTWLTPEHGLLTTVIKGACRPKSHFLSQFDIPDTCELLFYVKERNGIHIARECSPVARRCGLRENWRKYVCAEYAGMLLLRACVAGPQQSDIFRMTTDFYDNLNRSPASAALLMQWELRLLGALGMAPQLDACAQCGIGRENMISQGMERESWVFAPASGGALCASCVKSGVARSAFEGNRSPVGSFPAPPDILAIMAQWRRARSARIAERARCNARQERAIERILDAFLAYHLELDPVPRQKFYTMLRRFPSAQS